MSTTHTTFQQSPAWLTQDLTQKTAHYIQKYGEIPKSIKMYADNWKTDNDCHIYQMWPEKATQLLYKAKEAMIDFSNLAPKIFEHYEKVNVLDLYHTNGYSALPLVITLLEHNRLGKYIPVTATQGMAENAINSIYQTIMLSQSAPMRNLFKHSYIKSDIETQEFKDYVKTAIEDESGTTSQRQLNVYLLGENSLGNALNPEFFLKTIYNSMKTDEKLLLTQAIYRPGVEDTLINDYYKLLPYMTKTLEVAYALSPQHSCNIVFDEQINGIGVDIVNQKPSQFGNITLFENQTIRIFRSMRFKIENLHTMFTRVGFKVNHIMFDDLQDNAVILLSK